MLGELYAKLPTLASEMRLLAAGARMHERVNALVALSSYPTTDLHFELLPRLLRDRSGRVRALAADKIVSHGMRQLASVLGAAAAQETDVKVRAELRADLDYLIQGFHVDRRDEGIHVTCRPPRWSSISRFFTADQFDCEGKAWIEGVLKEASNEV